jgi:hypothetical protein
VRYVYDAFATQATRLSWKRHTLRCLLHSLAMSAALRTGSRQIRPHKRTFTTCWAAGASAVTRAGCSPRNEDASAQLPALTSTQPALATTPNLPPAKLRALISLYHSAETFITPATLDAAIDEAFVYSHQAGFSRVGMHEQDLAYLMGTLTRREAAPRFGASTADATIKFTAPGQTSHWSEDRVVNERDRLTSTTLLGLDPSGRPGLEVVQEEEERVQGWLKENAGKLKRAAEDSLKKPKN